MGLGGRAQRLAGRRCVRNDHARSAATAREGSGAHRSRRLRRACPSHFLRCVGAAIACESYATYGRTLSHHRPPRL